MNLENIAMESIRCGLSSNATQRMVKAVLKDYKCFFKSEVPLDSLLVVKSKVDRYLAS